MLRRTSLLLLVVVLLGCQLPAERFDKLALGLTRAEVKAMLGRPYFRAENMWEYRLTGGSYGWVAFDSQGNVTAWIREQAPRLRAGLLPLTEETLDRLRLGTPSEAVLQFLGEPARRDGDRWTYLSPRGQDLMLRFSPEGKLVEKSVRQGKEGPPAGAPAPLQPPAAGASQEIELQVPSH
jgi:outer membrane protein assembly factor BamE (lipoprotein component of BamABCDE complex)